MVVAVCASAFMCVCVCLHPPLPPLPLPTFPLHPFSSPHVRPWQIEVLADELERDLYLVGATAIEDKLQEGVPEAIATMQRVCLSLLARLCLSVVCGTDFFSFLFSRDAFHRETSASGS